jgi:hypothetical protein
VRSTPVQQGARQPRSDTQSRPASAFSASWCSFRSSVGASHIEQNGNHVNSWLQPSSMARRLSIANYEGRKRVRRRRPTMDAVKCRSRLDRKSPRPVSGAGLGSSDALNVPVICPTCQFFRSGRVDRSLDLFKTLNRRSLGAGWRSGRFGRRRRSDTAGGLWLRRRARLRCSLNPRTRRGASPPPGARDRGPGGKADQRTRHRANGSQHHRARDRAQRRIARALLRSCFERNERARDQCGDQNNPHGESPSDNRAHRARKIRRHEGSTLSQAPPFRGR